MTVLLVPLAHHPVLLSGDRMTQIFSRDSLLKYKSRLGRVQMQSSSKSLHMIPEEEEPRTSSECNLKRTFSTSYIEVSLAGRKDDRSTRLAPRNAANERSGTTSPAPSTSSASSYSLPTPTSSDDEFSSFNNHNIAEDNVRMSSYDTSFIELDSDDESDSEWYSQEFSKMIWPLPPSFPKQLPSRPESLQIEPLLVGATLTRPPNSPKRVVSHKHKRVSKKALPPLAIPAQSLPSPSIPQVVEPLESPNPVNQSRSRPLSLRRPPPRMSMPVDCLSDDFMIGEDQSHWSSDFDPAKDKLPSPPIISPTPRRVPSYFTMPQIPDSPSMYSQPSAHRHPYRGDFEDVGQIELDDVEFDLNIDMSTRLSLSSSSSPKDLEADFTLGLDALWNPKEASKLVPPIIAVSDTDENSQSSPVLETGKPWSSRSASYHDSNMDAQFHSPQQLDTLTIPALRSKWSNSTLTSVYEQQRSRSKFSAADKFKHYFGSPPLLKSKQQQEKQHKRMGSVGANASISLPLESQRPSRSLSPSMTPMPISPRTKKAQRQAVLIPASSLRKPGSSASSPLWKRQGVARGQS